MDKEFKRALFGLCWFHSILIERKKFKTLGWNVTYAFNDSDFGVCEDLIAMYMGKIKEGEPPIMEKKNKAPNSMQSHPVFDCRSQLRWQNH